MGDLDDAIREHLELKRRHGATEEEVTLQEREAQKQGALPSEGERFDDLETTAAAAEAPETAAVAPAAPAAGLPDELDPDEVLPEEALDLGAPPGEPAAGPGEPHPDWSSRDVHEDPDQDGEDVLEETPEFLEDMPEQDRLWFEQRPPKDFDFDD